MKDNLIKRMTAVAAAGVLLGATGCARVPIEHRVEVDSVLGCVFMPQSEILPLDIEGYSTRLTEQKGYDLKQVDSVLNQIKANSEGDLFGVRNAEQYQTGQRVACDAVGATVQYFTVKGVKKLVGGSKSSAAGGTCFDGFGNPTPC